MNACAVAETQYLIWDDYLKLGPLKAIDVVRDIADAGRLHALGFCVGGTILSCAAGVLAARGEHKLATMTLLTTMVDFADTGEIGLLIDETSIALREAMIGRGGILPGKELAFTFGKLSANDLIWRYVVENYFKGATPDAFDLLYWDSDSVSLPGPMYCWYARNTYLENKIKEAGQDDPMWPTGRPLTSCWPRVGALRVSSIHPPAKSATIGSMTVSIATPRIGWRMLLRSREAGGLIGTPG